MVCCFCISTASLSYCDNSWTLGIGELYVHACMHVYMLVCIWASSMYKHMTYACVCVPACMLTTFVRCIHMHCISSHVHAATRCQPFSHHPITCHCCCCAVSSAHCCGCGHDHYRSHLCCVCIPLHACLRGLWLPYCHSFCPGMKEQNLFNKQLLATADMQFLLSFCRHSPFLAVLLL